jgi:hypothetical protein
MNGMKHMKNRKNMKNMKNMKNIHDMKSCAIYDDLVTNPHNEAPGYSTVTL